MIPHTDPQARRNDASTLQPPEGIDERAWQSIARPEGRLWLIDERDADGSIVGTTERHPDGSKKNRPGGKRGLIIPDGELATYAGSSRHEPVLVAEGATDTAALFQLRFDVIGAPMAGHCGEWLAAMLAGRHVAIVAHADDAGRRGARKLAEAIVGRCESVKIIEPPGGVNDARDAVKAGANKDEFSEAIDHAESFNPAPAVGDGGHPTPEKSCPDLRDSASGHNSGPPPAPYTLVRLGDLEPAAPPVWIMPNYIAREHMTLLIGLWKAGKSTLLGHLLRDIYRGGGLATDRPAEFKIIVVSEESDRQWSRRRDELGIDQERVLLAKRSNHARPSMNEWLMMVDQLERDIHEHGIGLIIFDTIANLLPIDNENDAAQVGSAVSPLKALTQAGAAVVLVHHPGKTDKGEARVSRGSGVLPALVDAIVELRRYDASNSADRRRTLTGYGRWDIPGESVIELGPDGYRILGDPGNLRADDIKATALGLLPADPSASIAAEEIAAKWPHDAAPTARSIRGTLVKAAENGLCVRIGRGVSNDPYRFHRNLRSSPEESPSFSSDDEDLPI